MGSYLINDVISSQGVVMFFLLYFRSFVIILGGEDWFIIWLGLEVNIISFIRIIYRRNILRVEACLKYFFVQRLGSVMLLLLFFSRNLVDWLSCLVLRYKMGGAPFYYWFPSVCERIRWFSCFILISLQKIIPLIVMGYITSIILWVVLVLRMLVGAFGSFNQVKLRRLLTYSSIHHIGWLILCLVIDRSVWLLYLFLYIVILGGVIAILFMEKIFLVAGVYQGKFRWWFILGILRMGGMPPLVGFFIKILLFYYILLYNSIVVLLIIFMSVIMFYVYLRIAYGILFNKYEKYGWVLEERTRGFNYLWDSFYLGGFILGPLIGVIILL